MFQREMGPVEAPVTAREKRDKEELEAEKTQRSAIVNVRDSPFSPLFDRLITAKTESRLKTSNIQESLAVLFADRVASGDNAEGAALCPW